MGTEVQSSTTPTPLAAVQQCDEIEAPLEIESLCPGCNENGITKLISLNIPFYRQVIVMSFSCDHCGHRNSNLQSGEQAQVFKN